MQYIRSTFASHRIAWFVSCAVAVGAVAFNTPTFAGCNSGDNPNTSVLHGSGCRATAPGSTSTAVGAFADTTGGNYATALGTSSGTNGNYATSIGAYSGPNAVFTVHGSTAVGAFASGAGDYSTAVGAGSGINVGARADGDFSIAIGGGTTSDLRAANALGYRSIAIGQASSTRDFGTSVGFNTKTAFASTAIGTDAQALEDSSTAVGRFAKASANGSLALGQGAVATKPRSVALGGSSLANIADTVSVGTNTARRRIVNVQNGVANSDAATLGQVKAIATTAAIEALANETIAQAVGDTVSGDLQRELRQMRSMIERLQQEIAELKSQNMAALAK